MNEINENFSLVSCIHLKCQASSVLVKSDKEPDEQAQNNDDEEDEGAAEEIHDVIMIDNKHARIASASYFEALFSSPRIQMAFLVIASLRAKNY